MGARGGILRQLTINGREFDGANEVNVSVDLGGFVNDGSLNGNGTQHITQRRKEAGFGDLQVSIDSVRQDQEFLQAIADSGDLADITATFASGVTYTGALYLKGDLMKLTGDGMATFELKGPKLTQI